MFKIFTASAGLPFKYQQAFSRRDVHRFCRCFAKSHVTAEIRSVYSAETNDVFFFSQTFNENIFDRFNENFENHDNNCMKTSQIGSDLKNCRRAQQEKMKISNEAEKADT